MLIYLNGQMVEQERATVSLTDAGLQHGVGLFETMSAHHGRAFRLRQHLERLQGSAAALGLARSLDLDQFERAVHQTLEANELTEARLRLTVTAGDVSLLRGDPREVEPTVAVVASEPVRYDPAYFEQGISALVAPPGANPFDPLAGHKTLAYWGRLRTLRQAATVGAGEAIWLNISNHVASGAISNVFLVRGDELLTPIARGEEAAGALAAPVLPGIVRAAVLELAESLGLKATRRMISVEELLDADEIFLTNSSWYVLPVSKVERKTIGSGVVGQTTRRIREALLAMVERETSA